MIIGLTGLAQSGKSSVARQLQQKNNCSIIPFAGTLKSMLQLIGLSQEQLYGVEKEIPSELLCGQSPRHAMRTLGTEWGRDCISPEIWINDWERKVIAAHKTQNVVCDDLRFPNECQKIKSLGGITIRIRRPGTEDTSCNHPSETSVLSLPVDHEVYNIEGNYYAAYDEVTRILAGTDRVIRSPLVVENEE